MNVSVCRCPSSVMSCVPATMACPTCRCGPALVCGQPSCVWFWWPQMLALWSATSPGSQRRPSPHSSASSLSTRLWRSCFTWESTILSTCTTAWTTSPCIREYRHVTVLFRHPCSCCLCKKVCVNLYSAEVRAWDVWKQEALMSCVAHVVSVAVILQQCSNHVTLSVVCVTLPMFHTVYFRRASHSSDKVAVWKCNLFSCPQVSVLSACQRLG